LGKEKKGNVMKGTKMEKRKKEGNSETRRRLEVPPKKIFSYICHVIRS